MIWNDSGETAESWTSTAYKAAYRQTKGRGGPVGDDGAEVLCFLYNNLYPFELSDSRI